MIEESQKKKQNKTKEQMHFLRHIGGFKVRHVLEVLQYSIKCIPALKYANGNPISKRSGVRNEIATRNIIYPFRLLLILRVKTDHIQVWSWSRARTG